MNTFRRYPVLLVAVTMIVVLVAVLVLDQPALAQPEVTIASLSEDTLSLTAGKSTILKSKWLIQRVSIADPEVVDFVVTSPREVYVTAKAPGSTALTLWLEGKGVRTYNVEVSIDIVGFKRRLHDLVPEEKEILATGTNKTLTLSGRVSSAAKLSHVVTLANAYGGEGVNNLLEVSGVHQVMLEVRVAEMSKRLINRLGFNFAYVRGEDFGLSLLGQLAQLVEPQDANVPVDVVNGPAFLSSSNRVTSAFRFHIGSASWTGFIDALKQDGLLRVLAEPTLVALSGQTATFLGGGEYPVPVPQGLGTVGIEYKEYGVQLNFTPTVLDSNKISMKVRPVVSELDFTVALRLESYVVPGLTTRQAETTVELADGQSFAIAGLLREQVRDIADKYPLLGDLPVLGALFRSREWQREETELVIIVTPHLVKPLDMAQQTLPTDFYVAPDAWEFYGLGLREGREAPTTTVIMGDMDGDFGHMVPSPY